MVFVRGEVGGETMPKPSTQLIVYSAWGVSDRMTITLKKEDPWGGLGHDMTFIQERGEREGK